MDLMENVNRVFDAQGHPPPSGVYFRRSHHMAWKRLGLNRLQDAFHLGYAAYAINDHGLLNLVNYRSSFTAENVALVDRKHAICLRTTLLLLQRKAVRGNAAHTIMSFALGRWWQHLTIHPLSVWLQFLTRYCEFCSSEAYINQEFYVQDLVSMSRYDEFAFHLGDLHVKRHRSILPGELAQPGSVITCMHCLPEWYGWACRFCTR